MSESVWLIVVFIVFSLAALILPVIFRKSHEKNFEEWTKKENVKILSFEVTDRNKTPFSRLTTNRSFMFYRVRVLTKDAAEKTGYLCVAGQSSPFFSQKARAAWDDDTAIVA